MGIRSLFSKGAASKVATEAAKNPGVASALSGVKSVGPVGGKVLGGATSAISAGGTAIQGAAWSAGKSVFEAFEDPGYILFIAGILTFFIPTLENPLLTKIIALGLMFFSAFFVLKGKAIFTTVIFFVWYVYLNAPTDIETILVKGLFSLVVIFVLGMIAHGIFSKFSKSQGESFGEGVAGELTAFIPIGLFLFQVGLVEFLITSYNLPLTNLVKMLLYCIPWWAILGAFTAKSKNTFIKIGQVVLILYLVVIIAYTIPKTSAQESSLANVDQLLQARQELSQKAAVPKAYELFWYQVQCNMNPTMGEDPSICVERKQEEYQFNYYCIETAKVEAGTPSYEQCMKEQREKKEKEQIQISGISDPTIKKPTRGELVTDKFFPRELTVSANEPFRMQYPVELKISNPREQTFLVEIRCNFTKVGSSSNGSESFLGTINGGIPRSDPEGIVFNTFFAEGISPSQSFSCTPPSDKTLNGTYKLIYTANFVGLKTTSRLGRVFIGTKDAQWKKDWIDKILAAHFPGETYLSQGPEDFARLNFAFGHSGASPIIENNKSILLNSMIENLGSGEITAVKRYHLYLDNFGIKLGDGSCLEGEILVPNSKYNQRQVYLPSCEISSLPFEFTNPEMYIYHEFEGEIEYDYRIKKEESIRVMLR
ncbi:MAG: hypothetical protein WCV90_03670 [Candidatus Woesearchaeota archaeon]|jgi:hypothetical protein